VDQAPGALTSIEGGLNRSPRCLAQNRRPPRIVRRAFSGRRDAQVVLEMARTMSAWFLAQGRT
jgi:hypothetical protein